MKSKIKNSRGQGLIEYLIIVAFMAVSTIAVVRVLGQNLTARYSEVASALQGERRKVKSEKIQESHIKKKDLSNFMNGAGSRKSNESKQ